MINNNKWSKIKSAEAEEHEGKAELIFMTDFKTLVHKTLLTVVASKSLPEKFLQRLSTRKVQDGIPLIVGEEGILSCRGKKIVIPEQFSKST